MKTTILINCADQSGIINAVTGFISRHNGNVVYLDQHVDKEADVFFMRLESDFDDPQFSIDEFTDGFQRELAQVYKMQWSIHQAVPKPRMALFVSKYNHCLYDLLSRFHSEELEVDIPFIVSNHDDLRYIADQFEIPYFHIPVTKDTKQQAEEEQLRLLKEHQVDFIVLARYMQIVSAKIIDQYPNKIINIHHSFSTRFCGCKTLSCRI